MNTWEQNARNAYAVKQSKEEQARREYEQRENAKSAKMLRNLLAMMGIEADPNKNEWQVDGYVFSIHYEMYAFVQVRKSNQTWFIHTNYRYNDLVDIEDVPVDRAMQEKLGEALAKLDKPSPGMYANYVEEPDEEPATFKSPRELLLDALDNYLQSGEWHG